METKYETVTDEFPQLLAETVFALHKLPIPFSTIEQVVAEAMEEEAMYRFSQVEATTTTDRLLLKLINSWCEELSKLTGKPWKIEKLRITKYE